MNTHDLGAEFFIPSEVMKRAMSVVGFLKQEKSWMPIVKLRFLLVWIPGHFGVASFCFVEDLGTETCDVVLIVAVGMELVAGYAECAHDFVSVV